MHRDQVAHGGWCSAGHTVRITGDAFCAPLVARTQCPTCGELTWVERLINNVHPTTGKVIR